MPLAQHGRQTRPSCLNTAASRPFSFPFILFDAPRHSSYDDPLPSTSVASTSVRRPYARDELADN
jgi:hypothetical protein